MRLFLFVLIFSASLFPAYRYRRIEEGGKPVPPVSSQPLTPADQKKARDLLSRGMKEFRQGAYADAVPPFQQILKKYEQSAEAEAAALLLAQCLIRTGKYDEARWIINLFPKKYPESVQITRSVYLLGVIRAYDGDHFGAARNFLYVFYLSPNPDLVRLARDALIGLFRKALTADQILDLSRKMGEGSEIKGFAVYYAGLLLVNQRKYEKAAGLIRGFASSFANHPMRRQAEDLLSVAKEKRETVVKIGVLLPFTAENVFYNEVGASVFKGVRVAVKENNAGSAVKVKMVVRDTRASPVIAYQRARELLEEEKVAAIIGPLSSEEVCVVAALSERSGVPLLSPTASAVGIDSLGPHVFQLTPSKSAMMRCLAEYVFDSLKISEYAVLFPNDEYAGVMAGAFRSVMEEKGAELVSYDMYARGEKNFRPLLSRLHDRMVERIFEKRAVQEGGLLGRMEERSVEVDSSFMADSTVHLGAIFMPGYPEEIIMLGPQIPFYKIKTQMLGELGWYDATLLKHAGRYVDSAILAVDFISQPDSPEWKLFRDRFKSAFHEAPDIKAGLGYDAANLIFSQVRGNNENLLGRLQKIEEYRGATTVFTFDRDNHANRKAVLMHIVDEDFIQIHPR